MSLPGGRGQDAAIDPWGEEEEEDRLGRVGEDRVWGGFGVSGSCGGSVGFSRFCSLFFMFTVYSFNLKVDFSEVWKMRD